MRTLAFDIETAPLAEAELRARKPEFRAPKNYKTQQAIDAWCEDAYDAWLSNGAKYPTRGQVVAIGYVDNDQFEMANVERYGVEELEAQLLAGFWRRWEGTQMEGARWLGFAIKFFDLPFLIRRSWVHGIAVPKLVRVGRYWNECFADVQELWSCGLHEFAGLDEVAMTLGIGQKLGHGKDFADLLLKDPEAAREYLEADCRLPLAIAKRIGVI